MKRQIMAAIVIVFSIQHLLAGNTYYVPSRDYPTIQSAINASFDGDVIIVAPGVYTGFNNRDLDFHGNAITLRSQIDPNNPNWDIIRATIIDCGGSKFSPHRAFHFNGGETNNTKVLGFTIRNGYQRGALAASGRFAANPPVPYQSVTADPNGPPRAERGLDSSTSGGYGGGILCENASSPTIQFCIITDCNVSGGHGGDGAFGQSGPWLFQPPDPLDPNSPDPNSTPTQVNNGQWGGNGGNGSGIGHGGAIACLNSSSPLISDCIIQNNSAHGGRGGDGGAGGNAAAPPNYDQGFASNGGNAGISFGDGLGGGIYCENLSSPIVVNCTFINNTATVGILGIGGLAGQGNALPADQGGPASDGAMGSASSYGGIAGGAAYFLDDSDAYFINCAFTGNRATIGGTTYTIGGALYSDTFSFIPASIEIDTCEFTGNLGGAVYCGLGRTVEVNNSSFEENSAPSSSGGAIYIGPFGSVSIMDSNFISNSAGLDGGALKSQSNVFLVNCLLTNNTAQNGYGGGSDVYLNGSLLTIDVNKCSFIDNQSVYGGGLSSENFTADFVDCYLIGNDANRGGALDLSIGSIRIIGGFIEENKAANGYGGGLNCYATDANIIDCIIAGNSALGVYPYGGGGGGIYFYGYTDLHRLFNCLLAGNSATDDGGAVNSYNADSQISSCTFSNNVTGGYGGAVFSGWGSNTQITDSIFLNNNGNAVHEQPPSGQAIVRYSLFYQNPGGDYYDSGTGLKYSGSSQIGLIPGGSNNIYGDPLFETGLLGGYYLRQLPVQSLPQSPAVDSGSDTAENLGLDEFTTRTDSVGDTNQVDIGYHHYKSTAVEFFHLTVSVIGDHGTVTPTSGTYYAGAIVTLTATPDYGWRIKAWNGTNDDASRETTNTVVMNSDKVVTVQFEQPQTLIVGGGGEPGAYTNLGEAIQDAIDGDIIVVHEGQWMAHTFPFTIAGKAITIRSTNPDDPCVVARTILNSPVQIEEVGRDTVLAGFTISNFTILYPVPAADGTVASDCDGQNGGHIFGGGIAIGQLNQARVLLPGTVVNEASPTIINCVIRNINIWAGDGGNGIGNAACSAPGDGGWGGKAYGAGVYIGPDCKPLFKNVTIRDCNAIGGDGGNPGVLQGVSGYAGLWGDPEGLTNNTWFNGPYDEVWKYSGHGGGAYCDVNSAPEFIDCNFINNTVNGGSSGDDPSIIGHLRIDSYGAAVYCAAQCSAKFTNCTFIDNAPDVFGLTPLWRWSKLNQPQNVAVQLPDKYFAYGGAVAGVGYTRSYEGLTVNFEGGQPIFADCTFLNDTAPNGTGGAMHWMRAFEIIDRCFFTDCSALHGGAVYLTNGNQYILESTFTNNAATDVIGEGGAIFTFDANVGIADSNISSNTAVASGGGVFITSGSNVILKNTLIYDNNSQRDGGGVSVNVNSDVNIINSTITQNFGGKFGGGLYCSYNSLTKVIDSIIWGNFAADGHQIALASDDPYYTQPSVVDVSYSSVGPRYAFSEFGITPEGTQAGSGGGGAQVIEPQSIYDELTSNGQARIIISLDEPLELRKNMDWDSPADIAALHAEIDLRQNAVLSTLTPSEFTLNHRCDNITSFSGQITEDGLQKLMNNPMVHFIEPVRQMNWAMRQGLALTNGMGIRPTYSGSGVAVAISDSGVDYRHPKLGGGGFPNTKVIGGYDFGSNDDDPLPDLIAHGTCCAGIAAGGLANVGDYIGGVAYNAKIYALKISVGDGGPLTDAALASWDWCLTHKNDDPANPIIAISNSWGLAGFPINNSAAADALDPAFTALAAEAVEAGITIFAASGNDGFAGQGISWPAAMSDVISVGAVYDISDQVIGYSDTAAILDILAPSDPTYTTDIIGAGGYAAGDYYPYFNGTSSACPFAAGLAAVVQSAAKQAWGDYLTPEQVKMLLIAAGHSVTDTKVDIIKPRVDIGASIKALNSGPIYIEQQSTIEHNWWNKLSFTWNPLSHNLDVNDNPLFVDGFYLSQIASDQSVDSNDVDAGDTDAFNADLYRHTTRTDLEVEDYDSIIDLGWHYVRTTEFIGDLNYDGIVDLADIDRFLWNWHQECGFPDYCHGADFNKDGIVNFLDYAILVPNIGKKETTPPEPNPMTWEIFPMSQASASWVTMTATKAKDAYGGRVEYYFQRTNESGVPDGSIRNWDPSRTWIQNGLVKNARYGYRVKARDKKGNETGWSVIGVVIVGQESVPSAPTNLTAQPISQNQIDLAWTDTSFNETGFRIERRTDTSQYAPVDTVGVGITDYSDTGLAAATTYTYRVFAFNAAGDSAPSNEASATTPGGGGGTPVEPNEPNMISGEVDPNTSYQYFENGYWYHSVVAEVPDLGGPIPVWFRFQCLTSPIFSSQWVNAAGTFPHPVSAALPDVVIDVNGNIVIYTLVVKEGGAFGWGLDWQVCASYNANGTNPACSDPLRIPTPP